MKNAATTPEIVDPYATLENILKIIGRSWLSEEWRLEDIRLLAQEALAARSSRPVRKVPATAGLASGTQIRFKPTHRPVHAKRDDRHPT